mgnify:FL=1
MKSEDKSDKRCKKYILLILLSVLGSWIFAPILMTESKTVPFWAKTCNWFYDSTTSNIRTDCGHLISGGCPYCGNRIIIYENIKQLEEINE